MDDFIDKLKTIDIPFHNQSDVKKFLLSLDTNKNPVLRIIAWYLSLNLMNFKDISREFASLTQKYVETCKKELSDINNPLPTDERDLVKLDTERTIFWFKQMASKNGINDEELLNQSIFSVQRILTCLSQYDSFYHYMQGYDRYVFTTFLLGLQAMKELQTELNFAESVSFNLCKELLRIVDVNKFTCDNKFTMNHFAQIDQEIANARPEIYKQLISMNVSSVHFAMKWTLLSFADEHEYPDILLIWDHIIANRNIYLKYVSELCVAHVRQVASSDDEFIIQTIQNYKKWNLPEIISYAEQKIEISRWKRRLSFVVAYLILFLLMLIAKMFFYDRKNPFQK